MISINIDHTTTLGQAIVSAASNLNQDPSELATGLLFAHICKRKRAEVAAAAAAESAPAELPAPAPAPSMGLFKGIAAAEEDPAVWAVTDTPANA